MTDTPEILEDYIGSVPTTAEESSAFLQKLTQLKNRCAVAGIEFEQQVDDEGDPFAVISLQSGRAKRKVYVYLEAKADVLLAAQFEKYTFLNGYEAICSYQDKSVEVGLTGNHSSSRFLFERLLNSTDPKPSSASIELDPPAAMPGRPVIEISSATDDFGALLAVRSGTDVTLKLKGIRATQHDQALAEMRAYADSVLFQIDAIYGASFALVRERRRRFMPLRRRAVAIPLEYPRSHYNGEAISLYWYAKSALNMPLLRFLAFYQSIEYFFPRYSQTEARKRVSSVVRNPAFRPYNDDDLDHLISAIQTGRGRGIGTERAQLRAVVSECINSDEMRQYFSELKERELYFAGKTPKYHRISLANKTADVRDDVADRIYDIRCKIVHTKNEHSEDDVSMILPFSEDADQLLHDIDLVEFVARKVLVASSGELT